MLAWFNAEPWADLLYLAPLVTFGMLDLGCWPPIVAYGVLQFRLLATSWEIHLIKMRRKINHVTRTVFKLLTFQIMILLSYFWQVWQQFQFEGGSGPASQIQTSFHWDQFSSKGIHPYCWWKWKGNVWVRSKSRYIWWVFGFSSKLVKLNDFFWFSPLGRHPPPPWGEEGVVCSYVIGHFT